MARDIHIIEVAWIIVLFGKDTLTQSLEDSHVAFIGIGLALISKLIQADLSVSVDLLA